MSSTGVTPALVESSLSSLSPAHVVVHDVSSGCGAKFELFVAAQAFDGVALLARHRLVQEAIKSAGLMDKIHALTIKAWTLTEWEAKKSTIPAEAQ